MTQRAHTIAANECPPKAAPISYNEPGDRLNNSCAIQTAQLTFTNPKKNHASQIDQEKLLKKAQKKGRKEKKLEIRGSLMEPPLNLSSVPISLVYFIIIGLGRLKVRRRSLHPR
jgi:hypothetical protein